MASATELTGPETAPPRTGTRGRGPVSLRVVSLAVALAFVGPLGFLLIRNLAGLAGFADAATSTRTLLPLGRSVLLATVVAAAAAVLGTTAAWLVTRTDLPARRVWRLLLPLPLVIPSFIGAFALIAALAPGGLLEGAFRLAGFTQPPQLRGFAGAALVLSLLTYPYVYLPVAARLGQLPPSLEEAARLFGRRPAAVFRTVVLPQIRGAVLAGTLLVFLYTLSDFGVVALMDVPTMTVRLFETRLFDQTVALALGLQLGVLALVVVAVERRVSRRDRGHGADRTGRPLRVPLARWRGVGLAFVVGLLGFALLLPVAVLSFWAVRGVVRGSTRASALVADLSELVEPALNTAGASVAAAAVSVVVVLPVAWLLVRHGSRLAAATSNVVVAGFALPGIAIALALVFWTVGTPFYQTPQLLVLAYVVHFGAQAMTTATVAVGTVPRRLDEAARSLGAGRLRRLLRVELPLMTPGLLAGGGLVLLSTMKELPATLLLAPAGFQTLATRIWSATQDAFLADASVAALVLIVLSGVLTWSLVIRRSEAFR